jgi:hypothetical protein
MTNRGIFNFNDNTAELDQLMAQLKAAIESGSAADSAEVMALQAQIDAVNAKADQAEATGQNAREMVLRRDPRLTTLEDLATDLAGAVGAGNGEHARLDHRIDTIALTPGPRGADGHDGTPGPNGLDGKPGVNGANGADGLSAYQIARQQGYGGTQAQWIASLKGDKGDAGQQGAPGTPADMTRVASVETRTATLEARQVQIEYRDGIAVPAMLSLLGSAATFDITVTWATPFPDTNYLPTVQCTPLDAALIGKTASQVKTKTTTGIVVTVTTTAVLAAGKCVLSAVAYRKG